MKHLKIYNEFYSGFEFTGLTDLNSIERVELDNIIKLLEERSKKYLDNESCVVFRGTKNMDISNGVSKLVTLKNRKPKDTNVEISNMLDDSFKNELGYRLRSSGNFTTRSLSVADTYGTPRLFIPIGNYKYFWSAEIEDLFTYLDGCDWYHDFTNSVQSYNQSNSKLDYDDYLDDITYEVEGNINDIVSQYTDNKIAVSNYHEIIFMCDEYFLIDIKYTRFIEEYIRNRNT